MKNENIGIGLKQPYRSSPTQNPIKLGRKANSLAHWFWSQRINSLTFTVCSYEHGTEKTRTLSNIQQMSAR